MFAKTVKMVSLGSLFLIPLSPLIVTDGLFAPFIVGKAFCFYLLVEIAFVSWAMLAYMDPAYRLKITRISVAATLFLIVSLVADLVGFDPLKSIWSSFGRMSGWLTLFHLWAFYIVATAMLRPRGGEKKTLGHRWMNVWVVGAALSAAYGLSQVFGWSSTHGSGVRIDSFFGNPSYFAVYLLASIFICFYLYSIFTTSIKKSFYWQKWAYGILLLLFVFEIFRTQTRGAVAALFAGIVIILGVYAVFGKTEARKTRTMFGAAAIGLCIIAALYLGFRDASFIKDNAFLNRFSSISWQESAGRQYIWPIALKGIAEKPVIGWGKNNFPAVFEKYYDHRLNGQEPWVDQAHNVFLGQAVASGVLGLLLYLSIYFFLLSSLWKSGVSFTSKSILTGFVAAYLVHHLFIFETLSGSVLLWFVVGYVDSLSSVRVHGTPRLLTRKKMAGISSVGIIVLACTAYFFVVEPIRSNVHLSRAIRSCSTPLPDATSFVTVFAMHSSIAREESQEQLLHCTQTVLANPLATNALKQQMVDLSLQEIARAREDADESAKLDLLRGSLYEQIGNSTRAEAFFERAYELMPEKDLAAYSLSLFNLRQGRVEKAVSILEKLYAMNKDLVKVKMAYGTVLVAAGRYNEAILIPGIDITFLREVRISVNNKDYQKVVAVFENIVTPPDPIGVMLRQAQILYGQGHAEEALEILRKVMIERPDLKEQIEAAIKEAGRK